MFVPLSGGVPLDHSVAEPSVLPPVIVSSIQNNRIGTIVSDNPQLLQLKFIRILQIFIGVFL